MTDRDAFLRAIIEQSDDDLPRLIYADWLEDTCRPAEPERAEFIRVQCELATLEKSSHLDMTSVGAEMVAFPKSRHAYLRRRERELLESYQGNWTACWAWCQKITTSGVENCLNLYAPNGLAGILYRRGFVEEIISPWEDFRQHAAALRAATPLRKVRLTTAPDDDDCIRYGFKVLARPGQPSLWTADKFPGIEFELPDAVEAMRQRRDQALAEVTAEMERMLWSLEVGPRPVVAG